MITSTTRRIDLEIPSDPFWHSVGTHGTTLINALELTIPFEYLSISPWAQSLLKWHPQHRHRHGIQFVSCRKENINIRRFGVTKLENCFFSNSPLFMSVAYSVRYFPHPLYTVLRTFFLASIVLSGVIKYDAYLCYSDANTSSKCELYSSLQFSKHRWIFFVSHDARRSNILDLRGYSSMTRGVHDFERILQWNYGIYFNLCKQEEIFFFKNWAALCENMCNWKFPLERDSFITSLSNNRPGLL